MLNMAKLDYDKNTEYFFNTNSPTGTDAILVMSAEINCYMEVLILLEWIK